MADTQYFFPLLVKDLHPKIRDVIFPAMLPYASQHGVCFIGKAGRGKPPCVINPHSDSRPDATPLDSPVDSPRPQRREKHEISKEL